jgi:hypothetical protein
MAMRFNGENYRRTTGIRRSGPLPQDAVHWCDRPKQKVTLPKLACLDLDQVNIPEKVKTAGDLAREESERVRAALDNPPLPGRFAMHPDDDRRARGTGTCTVRLNDLKHKPPGQQVVKVRAFALTSKDRRRGRIIGPSRWTPDESGRSGEAQCASVRSDRN